VTFFFLLCRYPDPDWSIVFDSWNGDLSREDLCRIWQTSKRKFVYASLAGYLQTEKTQHGQVQLFQEY